jgi:crossover junction endodeoxyribonuclease RusA
MNKLILPWPPRPLSPNAREHWAVVSGAKKRYRLACFMLARQMDWAFPRGGADPLGHRVCPAKQAGARP